MNSRAPLPAAVRRRYWRRKGWRLSAGAGRYLHSRRCGLRHFAGALIALAAGLCVLAVFA